MRSMETSRRAFVLGSAGSLLAAAGLGGQVAPMTAQQVIDRIKPALGPPKPGNTVDGFKAGDPSTVVKGIVTLVSPTAPMLKRAIAEQRANLIITMEPLFYTANDDPGPRATDPIYLAKKKLIDDEKLVVYRLSDGWTPAFPDMFARPLAALMRGQPVAGVEHVYDVPETTLEKLLPLGNLPGSRVVGDRAMKVRRIFVSPGTTTLPGVMAGLQQADAVIAGEPREWEAVPYVLDANTAGRPKGMIVLGRVMSLDPGLNEGARWIQGQVSGLKAGHIYNVDYYWKPGAPGTGGRS